MGWRTSVAFQHHCQAWTGQSSPMSEHRTWNSLAHRSALSSLKTELVQALSANGIALLNYDDLNVRAMSASTQARVCSTMAKAREPRCERQILVVMLSLDAVLPCTIMVRKHAVQLHFPGGAWHRHRVSGCRGRMRGRDGPK